MTVHDCPDCRCGQLHDGITIGPVQGEARLVTCVCGHFLGYYGRYEQWSMDDAPFPTGQAAIMQRHQQHINGAST